MKEVVSYVTQDNLNGAIVYIVDMDGLIYFIVHYYRYNRFQLVKFLEYTNISHVGMP